MDGGSGRPKGAGKARPKGIRSAKIYPKARPGESHSNERLIHRGLTSNLMSPRVSGSQKKLPAVQEEQEEGEKSISEPDSK